MVVTGLVGDDGTDGNPDETGGKLVAAAMAAMVRVIVPVMPEGRPIPSVMSAVLVFPAIARGPHRPRRTTPPVARTGRNRAGVLSACLRAVALTATLVTTLMAGFGLVTAMARFRAVGVIAGRRSGDRREGKSHREGADQGKNYDF